MISVEKKGITVRQIVLTALFLALLVVLQYLSKPLGQFVTGSLVNFVLITAAVIGGTFCGVAVALVSPFLAFSLGIGPVFVQIIPLQALGNAVIVLSYILIMRLFLGRKLNSRLAWVTAIVTGAVLKFLVLYAGIVQIAIPLIPGLKPPQVEMLSATFGYPQLVTATLGGILAFLVVPLLMKSQKIQAK